MKKGWQTKSLGEIATVEYGYTDNSTIEGDYRYIRITDIDTNGELEQEDKKYIKYSKEAKKFTLEDNDLLMARTGATFAKVLLYKNHEPSVFASYLIRIKFIENIKNELYWYFSKSKNYWDQANRLASGSAQPHFNGAALNQIIFTFPESLEQQDRIVAILDEAFENIASAKANAEKNLKNARELFESHLQAVFTQRGEEWVEKTLEEIATVEYGFTDNSTTEGDYRYIRITDIDRNGELVPDYKKYIKFSKQAEKYILKDNDLLMARTGATFAKVLLYKNFELSVFASYLIRIRFSVNIENKLYWYFSKSKNYWNQANGLSSGSAQPHFNGAALKQVAFPFPKSLTDQQIIVAKFDALAEETQRLESIYKQKIAALDELKKALLHKAFAGEL